MLTVVSLINLKNFTPFVHFLSGMSHHRAENLELILKYVVSNEKLEDQGPKEDAFGNDVVTVMRLLQELLALALGQLYEISVSISVTCTSSHGSLSLYYS